MNKTDYLAIVAKNVHDMRQFKLKYKYTYNNYERSLIFDIARKINRYNQVIVPESTNLINEKNLYKDFLSSLEELNSDFIYDYYNKMISRIALVRSKAVQGDDAELDYVITNDKETKYCLNLPKEKLTITNQIGLAHEMGHIPEIDIPRETYFEYNETLPMFFEYISSLNCYGYLNGKDNFICERLSMELVEAYNILKIFKKCNSKENAERLYFTQLFADNYKFLESLDFALQLIDLYEKDKNLVVSELEKIIKGKSLNIVANDLEIDTSNCKRLLKEYKK